MKNLLKNFFILLVLLLPGIASVSQDSIFYHKSFIGITLTQLPFIDFRLSYERRISASHGIKLEFGYKPVTKYFTDATNINLGQSTTGWCYRNTARWYYASLGYRYYFNPKKTFYLSPEFFFKSMAADKIIYSYGISGSGSDISRNGYEIRSMNANLWGLNFIIGKRIRIKFTKGFNAGLDIFGGFSYRSKNIHTTIYGKTEIVHYHDESPGIITIPLSDNPDNTDEKFAQFNLQGGIIFFFSWK